MNKALIAKLLQPAVVISVAVAIALISVAVAYVYTSQKPAAAYVAPIEGAIVQSVTTTGTVQAATSLDLSFQSGGQISYVNAIVGTHVAAGTILARLSGTTLAAELEQAKAALAIQQAKLDGLQAGATSQTVQASQTAVTNAESTLSQADQSVLAAAQDAYAKADDAIHNRVDAFISNPRTPSPSLALTLNDAQLASSIVSDRVTMESLLANWQSYESSLSAASSSSDSDSVASTTLQYAAELSGYLNEVASGLTVASPTINYPVATIQAYESSIATARTNMSTVVTEMDTAKTAVTAAKATLASAQSALAVTVAPPTPSDLEAQEAAVASAQASVDLINAEIGQTIIAAPISGTITVDNADVGETAAAGSPLISMISDTEFQMVDYVSDADIAKVKVGDPVSVTLDAYQSGSSFPAHVIQVDPAATIQNGVSAYKVTLQFDQNDPLIQSGMTGSATITTGMQNNALSVPTSAVITEGTSTFVLVKSPAGDKQVQVQTGIESEAGMTEILTGLSSTDLVRTFGVAQ